MTWFISAVVNLKIKVQRNKMFMSYIFIRKCKKKKVIPHNQHKLLIAFILKNKKSLKVIIVKRQTSNKENWPNKKKWFLKYVSFIAAI